MRLQQIQHAARVAKAIVTARVAIFIQLILPAAAIVLARFGVVAAKQPVFKAVAVADDQSGIGKGAHVLLLDLVMLQQIVNHAHQEGNVAARTQRRIEIGHRRRAVKARVDHNHLRIIVRFCLVHPFKANRMRFGWVATHDQHHIGVFDVVPVVGHRAAAEARCKGGKSWAVAQHGLVLQRDDTQCAGKFMVEQPGFIAGG